MNRNDSRLLLNFEKRSKKLIKHMSLQIIKYIREENEQQMTIFVSCKNWLTPSCNPLDWKCAENNLGRKINNGGLGPHATFRCTTPH